MCTEREERCGDAEPNMTDTKVESIVVIIVVQSVCRAIIGASILTILINCVQDRSVGSTIVRLEGKDN